MPPKTRGAVRKPRRKGQKEYCAGTGAYQEHLQQHHRIDHRSDWRCYSWASAGEVGMKGSRWSTPYAAQMAAESAAKRAQEHGMRKVDVFVKGPGSGRETAIRRCRLLALRLDPSRMFPQALTTVAAHRSVAASN